MGWFSDMQEGVGQNISQVPAYASRMMGGGDAYQQYYPQAFAELQRQQALGTEAIRAGTERALGFEAPYRRVGEEALGAYAGELGLPTPAGVPTARERFRESPGYQFALRQALTGVERGMGARGYVGSGAEALALQRTATGLAEQEYQPYVARLGQLAGMGETAAGRAAGYTYGAGALMGQLAPRYAGLAAGLYGQEAALAEKLQQAREQQEAQERAGLGAGIGAIAGTLLPYVLPPLPV